VQRISLHKGSINSITKYKSKYKYRFEWEIMGKKDINQNEIFLTDTLGKKQRKKYSFLCHFPVSRTFHLSFLFYFYIVEQRSLKKKKNTMKMN